MFVHPIHLYASIHLYTPSGTDTPYMFPILLCASVCSQRLLHFVGHCRGPLHVGHLSMLDTSSCMGSASPYVLHPHSLIGFPVYLYVLVYVHVLWGIFPLCWGLGGVPHMLGVWGHQHHWVSICFILYLVVVHYVSCFYHSYDHYSSSYGGIF